MKVDLPKRRLIPRWTRKVLERPLLPVNPNATELDLLPEGRIVSLISESTGEGIGVLGDLLSLAMFPAARPHLKDVAEEVLAHGDRASPLMREIATSLLHDRSRIQHSDEVASVRSLRHALRDAPDNVPALLDLALLYCSVGKIQSAERALITAASLAPHNREVIRTRVRFLVHVGLPDKAHRLLVTHPRSQVDPWLMASEIAVADSAEAHSRFLGKARRQLLDAHRSDPRLAELAGAVAGAEMALGNFKAARSLFRRALAVTPNSNVIAQAVNDAPTIGLSVDLAHLFPGANAYEATVLEAYRSMDLVRAESGAEVWHREEPFSSRPLTLLSFLSSCRGDADAALAWAMRGTLAEPSDAALWGNRAYALAALNRLDEADQAISRSSQLDVGALSHQILATRGMIQLRRGHWDRGRALYQEAIALLTSMKNFERQALCKAFYAREAVVLRLPDREEILNDAVRSVESEPSVNALFVLASVGAVPATVLERSEHPSVKWIHDPSENILRRIDNRSGGDALAERARLKRTDERK